MADKLEAIAADPEAAASWQALSASGVVMHCVAPCFNHLRLPVARSVLPSLMRPFAAAQFDKRLQLEVASTLALRVSGLWQAAGEPAASELLSESGRLPSRGRLIHRDLQTG